jgi:hemerythrin-like domain-containing protein
MKLLEELAEEHQLVDAVAGSLVRFAQDGGGRESFREDVDDFLRFFRVFVSGFHHQREEETLFATLVERAEIPGDRGPLVALEADHRESARLLGELESSRDNPEQAVLVARKLAHHLWEHVDKEESVILPEAKQRLVRSGVARLEGRPPTSDEEAARRLGEQLTDRFPPLDDPDAIRGDGCVACSAFAVTCGGIEKEWWNDWETEYHKSLDEG